MPVPQATAPPLADGDWHAVAPEAAAAALDVDPAVGLTAAEAAARLERSGRNVPPAPYQPSVARVVLGRLADPTLAVLAAVLLVSLIIRDVSVVLLVAVVLFVDVVVGANEAVKVRRPVTALEQLWAATAMVRRGGRVIPVNATELVPGDIVSIVSGDVVPADGRLLEASSLLVREGALTGVARPAAKGPATVSDPGASLADRTDLVFAGSTVARGDGLLVVTATGGRSELGQIAVLLATVEREGSPLQARLRGLAGAAAVVAVVAAAAAGALGWLRGTETERIALLGVATAVAATPAAFRTFVRATLAVGVQRMTADGVVTRNLDAVASLGSLGAIDADPAGLLTLDRPTVRSVFYRDSWYTVEGDGAETSGRMLHVAGATLPGFDRLAYVAALATEVEADDDTTLGHATESALAVLAEKLGIDAAQSRVAYPSLATLPYDATLGLAASVHRLPLHGSPGSVTTLLVVGTPAALLDRSASADWSDDRAAPIDDARAAIEAAAERMLADGLTVVATGARSLPTAELPDDLDSIVDQLTFVGLVGTLDPARSASRSALADFAGAGIAVRLVTGEPPLVARATATRLGLDGTTGTATELATAQEDAAIDRLRGLGALARATAQDRLWLARTSRAAGTVTAAVGSGVVDGPALRGADAGVVVGRSSSVAGEAASVVIPEGDPASLVRAIAIGREAWDRVAAYAGLAATQLIGSLILFAAATFVGVNEGLPLAPVQVLFLGLVVTVFPVIAIASDVPDPDAMERPPPDPRARLADRPTLLRWTIAGLALGLATLAAYPVSTLMDWGVPAFDRPSVPMTMAFVTMGFGTILAGLAARRPLDWAFKSPLPRFLGILAVPVGLLFLSTELRVLQEFLVTVDLRQEQWGTALALGSVVFWVMEADKLLRRRVRIQFH
jgi:Ca2+-transporting ATPase